MRTFAPGHKPYPNATSDGFARPGRLFSRQHREVFHHSATDRAPERQRPALSQEFRDEQRSAAPTHFARDFSEISVHASARAIIQPKLKVDTALDVPGPQAKRAFGEAASGSPSPVPYCNAMESAFDEDFSGVKAYLGRGDAMDRLNAHAATSGEQIVFGGSSPDKRLVAHELAHVVQQRRGSAVQLKSQISGVDDAAEREADRVAGRAAAGERVTVSAAPSASVHRDIKDKKLDVPLGHFEIDMTAKEIKGSKIGEDGTISFEPNEKAPDSKSIRLSQAVKDFNVDTKADLDWGATTEPNLKTMQTAAGDKTHVTAKDETLKTIAKQHYGDPTCFDDIFAANTAALAATMATADGDKKLPEKLSLTIPHAVGGGFFIDHSSIDPKALVRKNKADPEVPQDYVWPGEEKPKINHHGSKAGKKIDPAVLKDFPGTLPGTKAHIQFTFETAARSEDVGIHYGTIRWSFDADEVNGKVAREVHSVTPGVSDTFRVAVDQFNEFYKNPHTVMKGETLRTIAEKYYGDPDKSGEILKANKDKIKDPDKIAPGLKLSIPKVRP